MNGAHDTMTIGIVGATGFIGAHLSRALASGGVRTVPISATSGGFDLDTGILTDTLLPAGPLDAVVYLSQSPRYREVPQQAPHVWSVNVVSALKAAEWARRSGARRFVYASSGNVYQPGFAAFREDDPVRRDNWYALSKVQAEEALGLYAGDFNITCARLFGVYGPGQRDKLVPNLVDAVRNQRPIALQPHPGDPTDVGGVRLSLSYVDDVVDVLAQLALADGPRTLNIAGTDVCSIQEIATCIGERLGMAPTFRIEREPRSGDLIADCTRLRAGWATTFRSFAVGLTTTAGDGQSEARR